MPNISTLAGAHAGLVSNETLLVFQWIAYCVVCQVINMLGVISNIINIACFIKQGFKESVNISLLGLAVSDLGCLLTLMWICICYTPAFEAADLTFDTTDVTYASTGMVHLTFSRITCWMTAFITLERCLCITTPLKVKLLITPRRTSIIVFIIYATLTLSQVPVYSVNRLGQKFFPDRNKTLLGLVYTPNMEYVEKISSYVNMFLPFIAFVTIISCTAILIITLYSNNEWRGKSRASAHTDNISQRNQKVAKMVLMISILFIACFVPVSIAFLVMSIEPSISVNGINRNLLFLLGGVCIILESVNSSANILIYYHVSSKYKEVFLKHICALRLSSPHISFKLRTKQNNYMM
ncbi:hypothetical protein BsWGS_10999 [Bradybaena similaris]